MKLSIIVPVYNVEQYVLRCVQSIYQQGLSEDEFEVILVNDGTQDDSFNRIESVIIEHSNIIIVEQSNQGLSAARNTGMLKASGDYFIFLDSDDLLVNNTLSQLLSFLEVNEVDMLVAGFVKMDNRDIDSFNGNYGSEFLTDLKSSYNMFLHDFNPYECYVWRTIYRKDFLNNNNIRFIPGLYFEDVPFTTECFLKAKKCAKTSLVFYVYRQRENSIVSTVNIKKIYDLNTVLAYLWDKWEDRSFSLDVRRRIMDTIFMTFSMAVWYVSHNPELMKQRHSFITDLNNKVPNLNFNNGFKQKFVSVFYHLMPITYIRIRSLI